VTERTRARGKYALNFHAGPLPEFGGWAFYNVAILEGASQYGCTCHLMDDGFDTGPIVEVRRFEIDAAAETAVSLEKKAQEEMILLFMQVVSNYEQSGSLRFQHQDPEQMRYLDAQQFQAMKEIPLDANEEVVDRIARAFWYPPYDVAYYQMPNGAKLEVIPAILAESPEVDRPSPRFVTEILCDVVSRRHPRECFDGTAAQTQVLHKCCKMLVKF
jgi:methionyl-tRNA formyltransferase